MIRGPVLALLFVVLPTSAGAVEWDFFPPRFDGAGIVLVPKAYHSSQDDFGVGLEAIRPFRTPLQGDLSVDSEFTVKGRLHTTGHGSAQAVATVYFGKGTWFLKSKVEFETLARRFWGLGSDSPESNEETYRPQSLLAYVELFHRVFDGFRVGGRVEWNDFRYLETEDGGLLDTRDYPGLCCDNAAGAGIVWEWDGRDNLYAPSSGVHAQGFALFFSEDMSGDFAFQNYHLDFRSYHDLGGGNVLALQAFTFALFGDPPIWRYAAVGGRAHSRGYQRGRFLERRMAAVQAEWRRPLIGRLDGVAFGGLANVAPAYNDFKLGTMRPTVGVGLRLHATEDRDLLIRADLAVGEESIEGDLSFGHAF